MEGIKNLLSFLYENWTLILVCTGLIVGIIKKTVDFFSKSDEEKIEIAKKQISEAMLKMVTVAEKDFMEWEKAGSIKRSQVIKQIYDEYPILSKAVDQEALIQWIDDAIDNSLKELRAIIETNKHKETETIK